MGDNSSDKPPGQSSDRAAESSGGGGSQPSLPLSEQSRSGGGLDVLSTALDRAKAESTTEASKAMLAELGFDDLKTAQTQLAKWREADDARKDDLTKAQESLARLERERDAAVAQAASTSHAARVERALLAKGAQPGQVQRLVRLVDVNPDGSDAEVAQAVDALAGEFPAGFGTVGGSAPSGVSGAQPPQQQSSGDAMAAGADRWRREQEKAPKFSVLRGNAS